MTKEFKKELVDYVNNFFDVCEVEKKVGFLHFTHGEDADGYGCHALSDLLTETTPYGFYPFEVKHLLYNNMKGNMIESMRDAETRYREFSEHDVDTVRVLITDLSATEDLVDFLEENGVDFLWIDHHTVTPELAERIENDPRFFIMNDEYDEDDFTDLMRSDEAFNREHYIGGRLKYSATALYYFALRMLKSDPLDITCFLDSFEENVINYLSDSDTYHFKKLRDRGFGIASISEVIHPEESESRPISMRYIMDAFSLIFKYQGSEVFLELFKKLYYKPVENEFLSSVETYPEFQLARLSHENRLGEYRFFRSNNVQFDFGWNQKRELIAFTPEPTGDFSIFSTWLFMEQPEIGMTLGVFPTSRTVTMRSPDDGSNVAEFCREHFNGGGHIHAAGGKMSPVCFVTMLRRYWEARDNRTQSILSLKQLGDESRLTELRKTLPEMPITELY